MFKFINNAITRYLTKESPPRKIPLCDFDRIQHELKICDVLLVEGRSRVANIIKYITESPWSHAAIYIGRLNDIDDPEVRRLISEHYKGDERAQLIIESDLGIGTVVNPLSIYANDHIRICRPKGLTHRDSQKITSFLANSLGKTYDVRHTIDLLRFLLPWRILPKRLGSTLFKVSDNNPDSEICSALIAKAFESVSFPVLPHVDIDEDTGVQFYRRNPKLYVPKDFDYSPYFEIIKYPIINVSDQPIYKKLPWSKDAYFLDEGKIVLFEKSSQSEEPGTDQAKPKTSYDNDEPQIEVSDEDQK
ncbi:MAG: YiiX/YebB-like N1pC/P60 family cysteine hydrolase [Gammaproteobacteria bacterium]